MSDKATIFIPDISGFTEFVSRTEIDHGSHIINELLDLIIDANQLDLTLSEIEGDAVLFYKKGDAIPAEDIALQAAEMFTRFHSRLRLIERDAVCQCGACQSVSDLTLKFVVHFGLIKEFLIRGFTKASGVDMIIAHRLLKNDIDSSEYIIASKSYLDEAGECSDSRFAWSSHEASYAGIGSVPCEYALLGSLHDSVPSPPPRPESTATVFDKTYEYEIHAPLDYCYELFVDLNIRDRWTPGFVSIVEDPETLRIGHHHVCVLENMNLAFDVLDFQTAEDSITYTERSEIVGMSIADVSELKFVRRSQELTDLIIEHSWVEGMKVPPEMAEQYDQIFNEFFRRFKIMCDEMYQEKLSEA